MMHNIKNSFLGGLGLCFVTYFRIFNLLLTGNPVPLQTIMYIVVN